MKTRNLVAAVLVLAVTAVCWRLGFWQIDRLHQKQALNAAQRAALANPPLEVSDPAMPLDSLRGRRVELEGRFDQSRQFLLAGRVQDGAPGVGVVTPLILSDSSHAVLVERGWLPSDDAATAHPERYPAPGLQRVVGFAEPLQSGRRGPPMLAVRSDSASLWSMRWLDRDSIGARVPYALAAFAVRALPGPGVPDLPRPAPPKPYDEIMHVNYAIQWFAFGAILLVGSIAFAARRRGARKSDLVIPPMPDGG